MSDINKIQIIHDVKETFNVKDTHLNELIDQIEKNEFRDNLDRFFRGYKIEDIYSYIHGALPWVKLVHGLEQNQLPLISKEKYQVPDYLCVFEDSKKNEHPILVEVKSVKGDKKSLELIKRQVNGLQKYANCLNLPFLVAIYWEKYGFWTHVPIDVFEEKTKKIKITIESAYKADVSIIFGDISFIISSPLFRKTIYGNTSQECPIHEKYGSVLSDFVSSNGTEFFKITAIESAIIDALINMDIESEKKEEGKTVVIEKSKDNYVIKLSNWILRHLGVFGVEPSFEYSDLSRRSIIELMKKLNITISYSIPAITGDISTAIYKQAFSGTFVWQNYESVHKDKNA